MDPYGDGQELQEGVHGRRHDPGRCIGELENESLHDPARLRRLPRPQPPLNAHQLRRVGPTLLKGRGWVKAGG